MTPRSPSFLADLPIALRAFEFAADAHDGQRRTVDDAPFLVHPLEVAVLLANRGLPDAVVAAALLHDSLEDADVPSEEVERHFGSEVRQLVEVLTDDPSIPDYADRKAALREQVGAAGETAMLVYAADKVCKVRELRAQTGHDPQRFGPATDDPHATARIEHYVASLLMLERELGEHPLVRQLRFELEVHDCFSPVPGRS
jgi:(p)ppGpp synthase/HD superfamily hydrolase